MLAQVRLKNERIGAITKERDLAVAKLEEQTKRANNLGRKLPLIVPPPPPAVTPPEPKNGRISDHIKIARFCRDGGEYSCAISELEKARSIDPSNKEIQRELENTRKACLAEKKVGQTGLPC